MFGQSLARRAIRLEQSVRCFRSNVTLRDVKTVAAPGVESVLKNAIPNSTKPVNAEQVLGTPMHKCTDFQKWMLVWMRKYAKIDQVPDTISVELLHKTQSQVRIRLANWMMFFTVCGCVWAAVTGKREAKAGQSLTKRNEDWHARINQEYQESLETQQRKTE